MITLMLVNQCAEVKVRRYDTDSEEDACRQFLRDWQNGQIVWDYEYANEAFTPEWIGRYGTEPLDDMEPQYENGVRTMEWYCTNGPKESDDEIVWGYFLHTTEHEDGQQVDGEGRS